MTDTSPADTSPSIDDTEVEDARTQRRRLAAVWLGTGSALAAMVGTGWYVVARNGHAPAGDMIGHAATAEWLRTLPWWDWRGWSDWFFGGQAIGVSYPPLGHAWMRFTDPYHGQMAAVAVGLLVLLPWGALRLSRAVGHGPRGQRAAVAAVVVLAAASGHMHWVLSGFHSERTFFGSWPAMLAVVIGLHVAAGAAHCRRPVATGVLAGAVVLFNATVAPGIAAVCVVLLATSGASFTRALRWAITAGAAALAVSAWWVVPFVAGWDRLVRWEVRLSEAWTTGGIWQVAVLTVVATGAAWAAQRDAGPSRRLALAAGAGLIVSVLADLAGFQRPERWLEFSILVAAAATASLLVGHSRQPVLKPARPVWTLLGLAALIVLVVVTLRLEFVPLAVWLMRGSRRSWAWGSALAWASVLALVPLWSQIRSPAPSERLTTALEAVAESGGPGAAGLVDLDSFYRTASGDVRACPWGLPWEAAAATNGRIRPLFGLYGDTSHSAEFLLAEGQLRDGRFNPSGRTRPHWFDAWDEAGKPSLDDPLRAEAMGARWYAVCDTDGIVSAIDLAGQSATGVSVEPHYGEDSWHQSAVGWWISIGASRETGSFHLTQQSRTVPALWHGGAASYPANRAAEGVTLHTDGDSLTVTSTTEGWAWLRVPWDPDWRSMGGTPVLKGGPGHLIVWADDGTTEFRWEVPGVVDAAAAAATGAALLAASGLAIVNRRRGWDSDPDRSRPAAHAVNVFADTVDEWAHAAATKLRRIVPRRRR